MAPETVTHTVRTPTPAPGQAPGSGIPLIALVLSGALRMRRDGDEPGEPTADAA